VAVEGSNNLPSLVGRVFVVLSFLCKVLSHTSFTLDSRRSVCPDIHLARLVNCRSESKDMALPLSPFESRVRTHALLESIGFLVLLPIGVLVARYTRTFTAR
jgi:hypothetical protein